jgi:hypothetical protein
VHSKHNNIHNSNKRTKYVKHIKGLPELNFDA